MNKRAPAILAAAALALGAAGCAATYQRQTEADLAEAARGLDPLPEPEGRHEAINPDGGLNGYVAAAMRRSPELRAAFERWRAAIHRIPQARRLPEPTLTYGYFIQSVETRVGPQRHRLGLSQAFPWPTKLTAGADAASIAARSKQRQFEALALDLRRRVADAYWRIWLIGRTREIERDQLEVLDGLSVSARARVEVGQANLADLNQVDLARARLTDALDGLDESEIAAEAELRALIGAPAGTPIPVAADPPPGGLPAEDQETLLAAALDHPRIESMALLGESADQRVRQAHAERAPGFAIGLDWIETGEAAQAGVPGSGTDPVILMLGIRLPLWAYAYRGAEEEARAEAEAHRADALNASYRAEAALDQALSALRDADRRIDLYENTLIPQAETTYLSVVGAYQTGGATVAATLIAQRELLDLTLALARARAEHALARARLEQVVGRDVDLRPRERSEEP